ncbi:hypothetical protein SeMB42_g01831 [Synchytrium endobioticum]|uniref:Trichome birefringence-like C-terminal domain-containing protein n=1 Tax=Synchytrium endobioticum TaxID=286115 RepID=A0A507DI04_9FUNG|nr:hypothetical protein SeLEV6574_g00433 [Synchytrium endobioticum]TPX51656.1 hypothetical protein SeMB42_g01831 [Synchytrium endobioticum]
MAQRRRLSTLLPTDTIKTYYKVGTIFVLIWTLTLLFRYTPSGVRLIPPSDNAPSAPSAPAYCPPWKIPRGEWLAATNLGHDISTSILKVPYDIGTCRDRFSAVYPALPSGIWGFERPFELEWKARSGCILHPVDGALWLHRYRDKHILFFGDSLTQQVYISFICALEATLAQNTSHAPPVRMEDPDPAHSLGISHGWLFPSHNMTTTFFRSTAWTSRIEQASPVWTYARRSALWVVSDGAWYNTHKELAQQFFDLESLASDLYAFKAAVGALNYTGTFIARSYLPPHFDTADNEWQGPVPEKTCVPARQTATLNPRHTMLKEVAEEAGWPFVDVYKEVLPLWFLHRPPNDCRHFMHPGVPEWTFQALHHSMVEAGML